MKANGHIKNFIFDLDETLYPPNIPIMKIVGKRIDEYMHKHLHIEKAEIPNIRKYLKNTYGTTLWGLMNEYNINPKEFLLYVHNLDYNTLLNKDDKLKRILSNLCGRLFIYTNASKDHAINVLKQLDVLECFDDIISIEDTNYLPKPHTSSFYNFIEKTGINCSESVFVENSSINLLTAKKMHIKTAIVWESSKNNEHFDYYLETIYNILMLAK
jgi:putative hydrolase of the HAD superfamily